MEDYDYEVYIKPIKEILDRINHCLIVGGISEMEYEEINKLIKEL
jgi:hypothetical protein